MNADNLTMLYRGDVEANASLQASVYTFLQCPKVVFLMFEAVCTDSAFSLVQGRKKLSFVPRTIVVPLLSRSLPASLSNVLLLVGVVFGPA